MKRILYLDIIRIVACLMIIAIHAPIPNSNIDGFILYANSAICSSGVGLFVMVSGALLLPVNMPTLSFLKKRLGKIVIPTFLWSFFYMFVQLKDGNVCFADIFSSLLSFPFSPQYNSVLWFIYMLAGLYLLAPIISPWLRCTSKKEILFYLMIWGVTLLFPLIRSCVGVNETTTGILYYFSGFMGFFLLGYYLENYVNIVPSWICILFLFLPLTIALLIKLYHINIGFFDLFWYLSFFVPMMSIGWFLLIKKVNCPIRFQRTLTLFSNCCFGIYLVHIFIMRSIVWQWDFVKNTGNAQIGIVILVTFIGSFLVTWLISFIPGAEYIVGYKYKK